MGAYGAIVEGLFKGAGSAKAGVEQRAIANFNAAAATQQAQDAREMGDEDAKQLGLKVRGLIGSQRTAFAGQGVVLSDGSALDVQMDTARIGALDAITIRNNAAREAWGFEVQAKNYKKGGQYAYRAANSQALGSVLGGIGESYNQGGFHFGKKSGSQPNY